MAAPTTRAEFIAKTAKTSKQKIADRIRVRTGDDLGNYVEYSATELATILADAEGWADQPTILVDTEDAEVEVELTDTEMDAIEAESYAVHAATADASLQDEIAAGNVDADDLPVSSDVPPAKLKKAAKEPKPEAPKKSIEALLAELKTEPTQSGRKKIRTQLRAAGYRISDHAEPKQPKPSKKSSRPKVKGKK